MTERVDHSRGTNGVHDLWAHKPVDGRQSAEALRGWQGTSAAEEKQVMAW